MGMTKRNTGRLPGRKGVRGLCAAGLAACALLLPGCWWLFADDTPTALEGQWLNQGYGVASILVFEGNAFFREDMILGTSQWVSGKFRIADDTTDPKQVDVRFEAMNDGANTYALGATWKGIFRLDGNRLWFELANEQHLDASERPTAFEHPDIYFTRIQD